MRRHWDARLPGAPPSTLSLIAVVMLAAVGCATARPAPVAPPLLTNSVVSSGGTPGTITTDDYQPVGDDAAGLLGCDVAAAAAPSPICETAPPSDEEFAAFRAEADRLGRHEFPLCRELGGAVASSLPHVRMYRKALIKYMGPHRYYGVGHSYEVDDVWMVRVARRLDDLNDRTIPELNRTLRHEVSHTIGATEAGDSGWTAEHYARNCS